MSIHSFTTDFLLFQVFSASRCYSRSTPVSGGFPPLRGVRLDSPVRRFVRHFSFCFARLSRLFCGVIGLDLFFILMREQFCGFVKLFCNEFARLLCFVFFFLERNLVHCLFRLITYGNLSVFDLV